MLEINAQNFMNAVREMQRIQVLIHTVLPDTEKDEAIPMEGRDSPISEVESMTEALMSLHANIAFVAAERLLTSLNHDADFTWRQLQAANADIEARLHDELGFVNMLVFGPAEKKYFLNGSDLLGQDVFDNLPSVVFEMEESAKCLAMSRPTASAFHSMRALEIAVKALAKFLGIPDPVKPSQKNWGEVLKYIKAAMSDKYPSSKSMPGSSGAKAQEIYASLDAVKNPWRNATMHTENIYQPYEADHILQCVNFLLMKLSLLCDEEGNPV